MVYLEPLELTPMELNQAWVSYYIHYEVRKEIIN